MRTFIAFFLPGTILVLLLVFFYEFGKSTVDMYRDMYRNEILKEHKKALIGRPTKRSNVPNTIHTNSKCTFKRNHNY